MHIHVLGLVDFSSQQRKQKESKTHKCSVQSHKWNENVVQIDSVLSIAISAIYNCFRFHSFTNIMHKYNTNVQCNSPLENWPYYITCIVRTWINEME